MGALQNEIAMAVCTKEASITRQQPLQESCFVFLGGAVFVQYFGGKLFFNRPGFELFAKIGYGVHCINFLVNQMRLL